MVLGVAIGASCFGVVVQLDEKNQQPPPMDKVVIADELKIEKFDQEEITHQLYTERRPVYEDVYCVKSSISDIGSSGVSYGCFKTKEERDKSLKSYSQYNKATLTIGLRKEE